jgi:hypothetical protein
MSRLDGGSRVALAPPRGTVSALEFPCVRSSWVTSCTFCIVMWLECVSVNFMHRKQRKESEFKNTMAVFLKRG